MQLELVRVDSAHTDTLPFLNRPTIMSALSYWVGWCTHARASLVDSSCLLASTVQFGVILPSAGTEQGESRLVFR